MKNSKRILGVALALIMIFNVFAIGTFAAFPDDTAVKLGIAADKATYAPGDEVILTFSAQSTAEVGNMNACGQWEIAYDSSVLVPYSTGTTLEDHGVELATSQQSGYVASASQVILSDTLIEAGLSDVTANDYGWDSILDVCVAINGCFEDSVSESYDFFTFKMKIADDAADGTYTIGYNPDGYGEWYQAVNSSDNIGDGAICGSTGDEIGVSSAYVFEFGTCEITVSSAPAIEVTHEGQQSKWNGGNTNNTAENYLFSFVGKFTGIDVATETATVDGVERDQVTNIESITAVATYSKTGATVECDTIYTIWEDGDGYKFRAVFRGFNPTDDGTMTVKFVVTMKDGTVYTESPYESVEYGRVINDIYTASVGNGFPEVA